MRRSGVGSGGGYGSRQHVEKPIRTGSGSRGTNPGGVGQLGNMQGSHVTRGEESNYRGDPLHGGRSFQPVPFGNEVALNVAAAVPVKGAMFTVPEVRASWREQSRQPTPSS
jgi:hypothetical protein